jgi:hypothetical protein
VTPNPRPGAGRLNLKGNRTSDDRFGIVGVSAVCAAAGAIRAGSDIGFGLLRGLGGWLPDGDTIVDSTWTADNGLNLTDPSYTTSTATIWISGGTADYAYRVHNTIVTAGGRTVDQKLWFKIKTNTSWPQSNRTAFPRA